MKKSKKLISLVLIAVFVSLYGGSIVFAQDVGLGVSFKRYPYFDVVNGNGRVNIETYVNGDSKEQIAAASVKTAVYDSRGRTFFSKAFNSSESGYSVETGIYFAFDNFDLNLPDGDYWATVASSTYGQAQSLLFGFDVRPIVAVPEIISLKCDANTDTMLDFSWTPVEGVESYKIFAHTEKGFHEDILKEYWTDEFKEVCDNEPRFILDKEFIKDYTKLSFYVVAYQEHHRRIARSQEIEVSIKPDYVVQFKDANLEKSVREALTKPLGDIYKSDVEKIEVLEAYSKDIKSLDGIEHLNNLTRIYMPDNQISDLTPLINLKKLRFLNLGYNQITNISCLEGLRDLEDIDITHNPVSDISVLGNLTLLQSVILSDTDVKDISVLERLPHLSRLDFSSNHVSDAGIFSNLVDLNYLDISDNNITDINMLKNHSKMENLNLSRNRISDISVLANFSCLTYLYLDYNEISDLTPISNLNHLKYLFAFNNQIKDIRPLENLKELEMLNLSWNEITDISPLASLSKLYSLSFGYNQIQNINVLGNLTNLTTLILCNNQIVDTTPLMNLQNLNWVNLANNRIGFIMPLSGLTNLKALFLSGNQIGTYVPVRSYYRNLTDKDFELDLIGKKINGYIAPDFSFTDAEAPLVKEGFRVELLGTGLVTTTDSNGYFEFDGISFVNCKNYALAISKEHYLPRLLNIPFETYAQASTKENPIMMWAGNISENGYISDNAINMQDIMKVATAFNSVSGGSRYVEGYDFNKDNAINMSDIMIVAKHFNATHTSYPEFVEF